MADNKKNFVFFFLFFIFCFVFCFVLCFFTLPRNRLDLEAVRR